MRLFFNQDDGMMILPSHMLSITLLFLLPLDWLNFNHGILWEAWFNILLFTIHKVCRLLCSATVLSKFFVVLLLQEPTLNCSRGWPVAARVMTWCAVLSAPRLQDLQFSFLRSPFTPWGYDVEFKVMVANVGHPVSSRPSCISVELLLHLSYSMLVMGEA